MHSRQRMAPAEDEGPRRTRLGRQRQVVATLSRHGFGLLAQRSPVPLPRIARAPAQPDAVRNAFEELGTTFIKLGQILSTRADLLPEAYILALSTLQDHLRPISEAAVRGTIVRELGAPPETLFARFDITPIATASVGQVHAATLPGGQQVVVKVQKPGIQREVDLDLLILRDLTHLLAEHLDVPSLHGLEEVVEQFSDSLREELDYMREARNAERFRAAVGATPRVAVPRIHWSLTTPRVLTMDRIGGAKISDLAALVALEVNRAALARDMAELVLRQVFEWGFFHADPHPGNYFVQAGGTIGVVDFGIMGLLDEATRRDMLLLLAGWVKGDIESMTDSLMSLGVARGGTDLARLRADMRRLVARYHDAMLRELDLSSMLGDLFSLARRHHLVLRGDLALMAKTLAMHEGIGLVLDPDFRLVEAARPYVAQALRRLYIPRLDAQSAALNVGMLLNLAMSFPQHAQRLLGRIERGDLGVMVRPEGMEPVMRDLHRMVNRLSVSILAAAFIVGLALLLQTVQSSHGSLILIVLFAGGLLGAAMLGLWLLISMWRSGRSY